MKRSTGKLTPFGKLVVKALTDQDMTKTQLADTIGTSPQYLSYQMFFGHDHTASDPQAGNLTSRRHAVCR